MNFVNMEINAVDFPSRPDHIIAKFSGLQSFYSFKKVNFSDSSSAVGKVECCVITGALRSETLEWKKQIIEKTTKKKSRTSEVEPDETIFTPSARRKQQKRQHLMDPESTVTLEEYRNNSNKERGMRAVYKCKICKQPKKDHTCIVVEEKEGEFIEEGGDVSWGQENTFEINLNCLDNEKGKEKDTSENGVNRRVTDLIDPGLRQELNSEKRGKKRRREEEEEEEQKDKEKEEPLTKKQRGEYKCRKCGLPKKGYICSGGSSDQGNKGNRMIKRRQKTNQKGREKKKGEGATQVLDQENDAMEIDPPVVETDKMDIDPPRSSIMGRIVSPITNIRRRISMIGNVFGSTNSSSTASVIPYPPNPSVPSNGQPDISPAVEQIPSLIQRSRNSIATLISTATGGLSNFISSTSSNNKRKRGNVSTRTTKKKTRRANDVT